MPHIPVKVPGLPESIVNAQIKNKLQASNGGSAVKPETPGLGSESPQPEPSVELRQRPDTPFDPAAGAGLFSRKIRERLNDSGLSLAQMRKLVVDDTVTNTSRGPEALGSTPLTGARVTLDSQGDAGDFVCSHVMRIDTELRTKHPELVSGFIHIPEHPNLDQTAEVVGLGIKGVSEKFANQAEVTVLLTGFTHFDTVTDNASGKFLFGDGKADSLDSFGLRAPESATMDAMMEQQFGKAAKIEPMIVKGETVGRSYTYVGADGKSRTIHLAGARLPVDNKLDAKSSGPNNPAGDGAGRIVREAYSAVRPDAIISLGVGVYDQTDRYEVEVNASGLKGGHYHGKPRANPSLGDLYRSVGLKQP